MNEKRLEEMNRDSLEWLRESSYAALLRAAQRAREIAEQTGTRLIVVPEGEDRTAEGED